MSVNIPLIRSVNNNKLYRVNTGSGRLMRMLSRNPNAYDYGCFMPPDIPLWTEGNSYKIGDIVYGIYDTDTLHACGVFQCRIDHIASLSNKPKTGISYGCKATTTLYWTALNHTISSPIYPPCGTLAYSGAEPYGGISNTPTGMLLKFSGLQPQTKYIDETKLPFVPNGTFCVPLGCSGYRYAPHNVVGGHFFSGMIEAENDPYGLLSWSMYILPSRGLWNCESGDFKMSFVCRKKTLNDNWSYLDFIFCGTQESLTECDTNIVINNVLIEYPDPYPETGTEEYDALLQAVLPAKICTYLEYNNLPYYRTFGSGFGGTMEFAGFCDYMTVGIDERTVEYDGTAAATVKVRFALYGSNGKVLVLKGSNIQCDLFKMRFNGTNWNTFLGAELIPLTSDEDGWFKYTVVRGEEDIVSFGITNVQAYSWKYKYSGTDLVGALNGA